MDALFDRLIEQTRPVTPDAFARSFGGLGEELRALLDTPHAHDLVAAVRREMERKPPLPWGAPRLRQVGYGQFTAVPALARGEVAAVDGRAVLPLETYSTGAMLCVGVGSLSHTRCDVSTLRYWSSRVDLDAVDSVGDYLRRQHENVFGISQTAYLRYHEIEHALAIEEPIVLVDGTLVYQWLLATASGERLYRRLFESPKRCIGVMKSLKENALFSLMGRAMQPGEVYVAETLHDHLSTSNASARNRGEGPGVFARRGVFEDVAPHVWRGLFKPADRAFGFEVHARDLEDLLPVLAADCQMNHVGHEIPYLLNRVDEHVRYHFKSAPLARHLEGEMATLAGDLPFGELDERRHR